MSLRHAQRLLRARQSTAAFLHAEAGQSVATSAPLTVLAERLALGNACSNSGGSLQRRQSPAAAVSGSGEPTLTSALRGFASSSLDGKSEPAAESAHDLGAGPAAAAPTAICSADGLSEQYTQIGRISGHYQVPRKLAFAVVEVGPTQFRVSQGDTIVTEKLRGLDVNDKISLNRVMMLGSPDETIIGRPCIPDATVTAAVEEQFQDGKVLIFKKRRRKHSRRLNGHRQHLTTLRILEISGIDAEAPVVDKTRPKWWEARATATRDADAVAAVA